MTLSRRTLMKLAGALPAGKLIGINVAQADTITFSHATTLYDDIKYPADFKHFDYVRPDAPKGGKVRLYSLGGFDSLNPFTFKGDSITATTNETLLTASLDEPSTAYGLLASGIWFPEDRSRVVYKLRPEARFHDGSPITVGDIIWSLDARRNAHPHYSQYWRNIAKAEQTGEHELTFVFDQKGNRELPSIAGQVTALSKAWWTGTGANGKPRDINEPTLEVPMGSGAYSIGKVKPGESFSLVRVPGYWGQDLPVNVGQDNFDEIEYTFFKDAQVAFEAFKGDQYDYRLETSSKIWATGYDFPAVKDGRVVQEKITLQEVQPLVGWIFNLRRAIFQDDRVRRAFNLAFDFEWSNQNLFYGQYTRGRSLFNNSEFEAKGPPSPEELALLEPWRADLPASVFSAAYTNPVNADPATRRKNLRAAADLLKEAGWAISQDGGKNVLKNGKGEQLRAEILLDGPAYERVALPYQQQLALLGITVDIRTIDPAQAEQRRAAFDYDIIVHGWAQSLSPGNEQRSMWGSAAADEKGSQNYAGIKNKAIDALIEKVIFVNNRQELVTACRALDRAVMSLNILVPSWYIPYERIAHWDRFGHPEKMPTLSTGFPSIWWWDDDKARKIKG